MMLRYRIRPPYVTMLNWPEEVTIATVNGWGLHWSLTFGAGCARNAPQPGRTSRLRPSTTPGHGNRWRPPRRRLGTRRSNYDGATIIEFKQIEFLDLTLITNVPGHHQR